MAMIGKVRRMFFREKKSVREIVRLTSLSRNTVRKWLKAAVVEEPKYRRSETPGKLTAFHDAIRQALKVDAHRPRHERRTARALHGQVRAEGYAGGYSRVTDFIRAWRQGEGQSIATTAFVPLAFELGEAFQFDWSEEGLVVGGIYYRSKRSANPSFRPNLKLRTLRSPRRQGKRGGYGSGTDGAMPGAGVGVSGVWHEGQGVGGGQWGGAAVAAELVRSCSTVAGAAGRGRGGAAGSTWRIRGSARGGGAPIGGGRPERSAGTGRGCRAGRDALAAGACA